MISQAVMYIVVGLVSALVIFVLWPLENIAADNYLLTYHDRCEQSGERFLFVFPSDTNQPDNIQSGAAATALTKESCANSGPNTTTSDLWTTATVPVGTIVNEHGEKVGTTKGQKVFQIEPAGVWVTPSDLQAEYSQLSRLLISVVPLVTAAGFFALAGFNMFMARGQAIGAAGIGSVVLEPILQLILTIIQLLVSPFLMDFASDAYIWVARDYMTIWDQFGQVVRLVFGFFPILFNASLLGWVSFAAWRSYGRYRGGRAMAM